METDPLRIEERSLRVCILDLASDLSRRTSMQP